MIVVDSREPRYIIDRLKSDGIPVSKDFLEIGDYLLPNDVVIERKSGSDFILSIRDNRLWNQLENLRQYEHPIVIVESENIWKDMYFSNSQYIHKSYFGAISTIAISFGIPVITVESREDTVRLLKSIYKRVTSEGKSERPVKKLRKAKSMEEVREDMLAQIPGLSIKKSKKLLECFGTIQNIANAKQDEFELVEGVGKKLAKTIYEVFH